MPKKPRRPRLSGKTRPITPEIAEILERQKERFVQKFGREPGPNAPIFFDPDKPVPTAIQPETVLAAFEEAAKRAGIDPVLIYAIRKTGLIVSEDNKELLRPSELKEWNDAIEEGQRLLGGKTK